MNKNGIVKIKSQLGKMYPAYKFNIKIDDAVNQYHFVMSDDRKVLGTFVIRGNTPLNVFWEKIKAWVLVTLRNY